VSVEIIDSADLDAIRGAADSLREGAVVVAQTDTNYGIFCNPFSESACKRIYEIKKRDGAKPLSLFVSSPTDWIRWAYAPVDIDVNAITEQYWPGPLNLIMRKKPIVPDWVTSGFDTVSVVHNVSIVVNLLAIYSGLPLAASSANISGSMDEGLVTFELAIDHIGSDVDFAVRGSQASQHTMSSTILSLEGEPTIVRQGDLSANALRGVVPELHA